MSFATTLDAAVPVVVAAAAAANDGDCKDDATGSDVGDLRFKKSLLLADI